VRKTKGP